MSGFGNRFNLPLWCICLAVTPIAHAQFAVVDIGAITQLITQARTLQQQLLTARDSLAQVQAEYRATTGRRGMERLLAATPRNYLPANWAELETAVQTPAGTYGALSGSALAALNQNAVLSPRQLAGLPEGDRQQLESSRRLAATRQAITHAALTMTSSRFAALQQLIDVLPAATDQKAVLDLQARVAAENAMLQNEQTKLQALYQAIEAQDRVGEQQLRERVIADHGQFASRFRPSP